MCFQKLLDSPGLRLAEFEVRDYLEFGRRRLARTIAACWRAQMKSRVDLCGSPFG